MNGVNNFDEQANALAEVLKTQDVSQMMKDGIWNIIKTVLFKDVGAAVEGGLSLSNVLFHMPTALFWAKEERFFRGCFLSREEQLKLSQKFSRDNEDYIEFVKRHIMISVLYTC